MQGAGEDRLRFGVRLLFVLAALSATAPAQEPFFSEDLGIRFPAMIGGLPLVDVTNFEQSQHGLGTGLSYRKDGIKADIYIYTAGFDVIASGVKSKLMTGHFYAISRDVMEMEKFGHYQNVEILTSKEELPVGRLDFLHAEMRFTQEGVPMESHVYLTGLSNRFFKIRFSFPVSQADAAHAIKDAFFQKLGGILNDPPAS